MPTGISSVGELGCATRLLKAHDDNFAEAGWIILLSPVTERDNFFSACWKSSQNSAQVKIYANAISLVAQRYIGVVGYMVIVKRTSAVDFVDDAEFVAALRANAMLGADAGDCSFLPHAADIATSTLPKLSCLGSDSRDESGGEYIAEQGLF